ncbi:MAG: SDR family NAD(P)-dependent oxidoreductase [Deltaproteobacteria bacterium]|nr:SDR family NAD(P)-dependent oxidoreductase [Deltaproteobacteria bacterium]
MTLNAMNDKVCLVSGATSGIGYASCVALAAQGARVIMLCRDQFRGAKARQAIIQRTGAAQIELVTADLSALAEVRRAAVEINQRFARLDVVVHCAGALFYRRQLTVDALESNLMVNYLSGFLLIRELSELLRQSAPARVVIVSGEYHRRARIDFDDLQGERHYSPLRAAAQATLAKAVFSVELARRWADCGITANCFHPGIVRSGLTRGLPWYLRLAVKTVEPFLASPERGARTSVFLASSPKIGGVTGSYFIDCRAVRPAAAVNDPRLAERLWRVSEALVA